MYEAFLLEISILLPYFLFNWKIKDIVTTHAILSGSIFMLKEELPMHWIWKSLWLKISLKLIAIYEIIRRWYIQNRIHGIPALFLFFCLSSFDITNFMAKLISLCILLNIGWAFDWCKHKYWSNMRNVLPCTVCIQMKWCIIESIGENIYFET